MKRNREYIKRLGLIKKLGYSSYKEYLNSPHWAKTKNEVYKRHGKKCYICGSLNKIQIHHLIYTVKNIKRGSTSNLMPVCYICHESIYELGKLQNKSEYQATKMFCEKRGIIWQKVVADICQHGKKNKNYIKDLNEKAINMWIKKGASLEQAKRLA